jgi:hypothetical protein
MLWIATLDTSLMSASSKKWSVAKLSPIEQLGCLPRSWSAKEVGTNSRERNAIVFNFEDERHHVPDVRAQLAVGPVDVHGHAGIGAVGARAGLRGELAACGIRLGVIPKEMYINIAAKR